MSDLRARLALEDGTVFQGFSCGADGESGGELVFNTSMTGYQEVLTDPSYAGQLVVMTYPQIGNYGITASDSESPRPALAAFVVRELCRHPSNFESVETAGAFLRRHGVPAIEGIDTRALTLRLRSKGALRALVSTSDHDAARLVRKARALPPLAGRDLARTVSCAEAYSWTEGLRGEGAAAALRPPRTQAPRVLVLDFGVKRGILRCLAAAGCRVTVVGASTTAAEILRSGADGVLLSNGPGDPEPVTYAIDAVRRLLDARMPLFGICLGHQLLGLALGGRTFKLKFGHHGANHPVQDLATGKVEITAQNHGFCVDLGSLPREMRTTHINLNDRTSEGMAHSQLPAFSVQYHPEASAGPHDARHLFERFVDLMKANKKACRGARHAFGEPGTERKSTHSDRSPS